MNALFSTSARTLAARTGNVSFRDRTQLAFRDHTQLGAFQRERTTRPNFLRYTGGVRPKGAIQDDEPVEDKQQRLEAVLFLANEPLSTRKLSQFANLADGTQARTLIRRLNEKYDAIGRAFRIEEMAGGFRFLTRPRFATWLKRLRHVPENLRFSAPALETLAVVAYRQPVLRAEIEGIRGVSCGEILRQLLERDQIRISGRSEELGRPYLYGTTKRFLQVFGLKSLDQLPRPDWFQRSEEEIVGDD